MGYPVGGGGGDVQGIYRHNHLKSYPHASLYKKASEKPNRSIKEAGQAKHNPKTNESIFDLSKKQNLRSSTNFPRNQ